MSDDLKRNETDEKPEADHLENDVRAYADSELKEVSGGVRPGDLLVKDLNYTQGTDIRLAPSKTFHLPQEYWSTLPGMKGRVTPVEEIGGWPVNDNPNDNPVHDLEIDVMGSKDSAW